MADLPCFYQCLLMDINQRHCLVQKLLGNIKDGHLKSLAGKALCHAASHDSPTSDKHLFDLVWIHLLFPFFLL